MLKIFYDVQVKWLLFDLCLIWKFVLKFSSSGRKCLAFYIKLFKFSSLFYVQDQYVSTYDLKHLKASLLLDNFFLTFALGVQFILTSEDYFIRKGMQKNWNEESFYNIFMLEFVINLVTAALPNLELWIF